MSVVCCEKVGGIRSGSTRRAGGRGGSRADVAELDPPQVDGFPAPLVARPDLDLQLAGLGTSIVPASNSENLSHEPVAGGLI